MLSSRPVSVMARTETAGEAVRDVAEAERAQGHAGHEEAEDRADPQTMEQRDRDPRGREKQQGLARTVRKRLPHVTAPRLRRPAPRRQSGW